MCSAFCTYATTGYYYLIYLHSNLMPFACYTNCWISNMLIFSGQIFYEQTTSKEIWLNGTSIPLRVRFWVKSQLVKKMVLQLTKKTNYTIEFYIHVFLIFMVIELFGFVVCLGRKGACSSGSSVFWWIGFHDSCGIVGSMSRS